MHRGAVTVPETAAGLPAALLDLPDPLCRLGVLHRLTVVLIAAICAVAVSNRSYTAIAEWFPDVPAATGARGGHRPGPSPVGNDDPLQVAGRGSRPAHRLRQRLNGHPDNGDSTVPAAGSHRVRQDPTLLPHYRHRRSACPRRL
ncbi:hypothetical protein Strop_0578 [Salinispora tropica CNB-440]|uniref:H repeat-associated protein N-terminal domain-containing protein n=1 Tax=Salinispora tropica (strain ATCC BAA-916 / DSM 44818 / JCM 13857 / NBRC 105044 / CNB-440) TaxID=369723 RepID=A4X2F9_SALTO|nr:hypothetical protein Strop_0578 [Salinispora tropica CNB-440]